MNDAELADLVAQLRDVLRANDHADKADWLVVREQALRSGTSEERAVVRAELRRIINGMGGLNDLYLPTPDAREWLHTLTETLWQATKA